MCPSTGARGVRSPKTEDSTRTTTRVVREVLRRRRRVESGVETDRLILGRGRCKDQKVVWFMKERSPGRMDREKRTLNLQGKVLWWLTHRTNYLYIEKGHDLRPSRPRPTVVRTKDHSRDGNRTPVCEERHRSVPEGKNE